MIFAPRRLCLTGFALIALVTLTACVGGPNPIVTVTQTVPPVTVSATPIPIAAPPPVAPEPEPTPEPEPPPPPPAPPVPPNPMGGQTDGGNTSTTPLVGDTGSQPFAVGPSNPLNEYEYSYTVAGQDQVLAIASRFNLQTDDIVRVNFRCSNPLELQPGDVLDIRWPLDSEQVGSGCG